jgi:hypothetical protein
MKFHNIMYLYTLKYNFSMLRIITIMLNKLNSVLKAVLKPLDDKRVSVPLSVLLVLYSGLIAPEPPALLEDIMQNPLARLVALGLLTLIMAKGNLQLALLSTVAIVLTLGLATRSTIIYQVVDVAKDATEQVLDVAEDAVDAVGGVVFGDEEPDQHNTLANVQGI